MLYKICLLFREVKENTSGKNENESSIKNYFSVHVNHSRDEFSILFTENIYEKFFNILYHIIRDMIAKTTKYNQDHHHPLHGIIKPKSWIVHIV